MSDRWTIQGWTTGDLNALVKSLGGEEIARKIQRGESRIILKPALKTLFDKNGRRIPENLSANVCDANRDFQFDQPEMKQELDYGKRILRLRNELGAYAGIITAKFFQLKIERLLALIQDNSQIANIINGVWLPVLLSKFITDDIGKELEYYLTAVGNGYVKTFSDRQFYNHRKGELAGKVSIADGSRQDQLIERMKQGPVIGIHFPNPLQGFSINACREQMSTLPKGFILSGPDTAIAMAMYPDILACGHNTPSLDLAAFSWESTNFSFGFEAGDGGLIFDVTDLLVGAYANSSGGLLFLG